MYSETLGSSETAKRWRIRQQLMKLRGSSTCLMYSLRNNDSMSLRARLQPC